MTAEVLTHAIDFVSKTPMNVGRLTLADGTVLLAKREHDGPWLWTWWGGQLRAPEGQRVGGEPLATLKAAPRIPIADWAASGPKDETDVGGTNEDVGYLIEPGPEEGERG